jgi:hypothetical protein
MSTNRNLLKEAIADAKTVKETAIANAKAVLEESFAPQLKSMISLKLQEMAAEDEEDNLKEVGFGKGRAEGDVGFSDMSKALDEDEYGDEGSMEEDLDLNELFGELNEDENEDEEVEVEKSEEDEEGGEPIDLEDFTDEDLKKMIEDVLMDLMKNGEVEVDAEEDETGDKEEIEMPDDEEINLEELLKEIDAMDDEMKKEGMNYEEDLEEGLTDLWNKLTMSAGLNAVAKSWFKQNKAEILKLKDNPDDAAVDALLNRFESEMKSKYASSGIFNSDRNEIRRIITGKESGGSVGTAAGPAGTQYESLKSELDEAYATIETLRQDLNEINLLNAKLLYTNKIFKSKNLNENQKVKVLSSFDKATTVGEVKLVFETLNEGLKVKATKLNENLGSASKVLNAPKKQPIVESNDMVARFQKLAGII